MYAAIALRCGGMVLWGWQLAGGCLATAPLTGRWCWILIGCEQHVLAATYLELNSKYPALAPFMGPRRGAADSGSRGIG